MKLYNKMENLISENTMKKEEICMKLKCIKILTMNLATNLLGFELSC